MAEDIRKKMFRFDGQTDLTYLEVKTWRSVLYSMVSANRAYIEHISEAADALKMFTELCVHYDKTGNNSKSAAERISQMLSKISDCHDEVWGDFASFTDLAGPFGDLLQLSDNGFDLLKKKATSQLKEHEKLEKAASKAWKYHLKRVKKKEKLQLKLAKTLTAEEIKQDKKFFISGRKAELALSQYNICFENEVTHRDGLAEQTDSLKKEYLKEEKTKLDTMFSFINDALARIQILTPYGLVDFDDLNFEPVEAKTKAMAKAGWEVHLKEYIFPEQKGVKDTSKQDATEDDDGDDDDVSDEEDSDDDNDDEIADVYRYSRGEKKQVSVRSLAAPKLNNEDSGMNDVLKEILESLDTEPAFAFAKIKSTDQEPKPEKLVDNKEKPRRRNRSRKPSPEPAKDRSRDSSTESTKNRSHDNSPVCKRGRSRGSSPAPRKRKPLKPNQQSEDRSHRSKEEIGYGRSREPSPETFVHDLTTGETRGKSLSRASSRKVKTEDGQPSSRSKSSNDASRRSRRRKSVDADQTTLVQDFHEQDALEQTTLVQDFHEQDALEQTTLVQDFHEQDSLEHPATHGRNQWVESSQESSDVRLKERSRKKEQVGFQETQESGSKSSGHPKESDNAGIRSESRRHRRAAKQADLDEKGTSASRDNQSSHYDTTAPRDDRDVPGSSESKHHKGSKLAKKGSNKSEDNNNTKVSLAQHDENSVVFKSNVTVYAVEDHEKQSSKEISIRKGMKLKQTRCVDPNGMAYGFKKTKLGLKKYGFYPADSVSLMRPDRAE